jgi:hypothetical protein
MYIVARNSKEEFFIHQLAASLRFGRESICLSQQNNRNSTKSSGNEVTSPSGGVKRKPMGVTIKLWKPQLRKCSTTSKAEALVIGPFGVPEEDVIPYDTPMTPHQQANQAAASSDQKGNLATDNFESSSNSSILLGWTIKYLLTSNGELKVKVHLDASTLPIAIPRVGMQFNIRKDMQQIIYKGNGPHECYPVCNSFLSLLRWLVFIFVLFFIIGPKGIVYSYCAQGPSG